VSGASFTAYVTMTTTQNMRLTSLDDVQIRPFQRRDLIAVQHLFKDGFASYDKSVQEAREHYIPDVLSNDLQDIEKHYLNVKGANFWVAEEVNEKSSRVVGSVGIIPNHGSVSVVPGGHGSIDKIPNNESVEKIIRNTGSIDKKTNIDSSFNDKIPNSVRTIPNNAGTRLKYNTDEADCVDANGEVKDFVLQRMFVDVSYHGKGLAQLLMKQAEDFVFAQQGCKITLNTGGDMKQACRFYEKMGYKTIRVENIRISDFYPASPDVTIAMHFFEKKLNKQDHILTC